jgi:hypothetical protein
MAPLAVWETVSLRVWLPVAVPVPAVGGRDGGARARAQGRRGGLPLTEGDAAGVCAPVGVPLPVLMRVGVP